MGHIESYFFFEKTKVCKHGDKISESTGSHSIMLDRITSKVTRLLSVKVKVELQKARAWYAHSLFTLSGGRTVPSPYSIVIDPVNFCNLNCPLCPSGLDRMDYPKSMMTEETFRSVLASIPSLKHISLFNWGEPFLNPDIIKMIRYAASRNILVSISSHFSFNKPDKFWREVIESGLANLVISLDGITQESYSRYRVGGDIGLVLANIGRLMGLKKRLRTPWPRVTWKMIVNRFNENEIDRAREAAKDLGVGFQVVGMGIGDDLPDFEFESSIRDRMKYWLPEKRDYVLSCYRGEYKLPLYNEPCPHLFTTLTVNPDGKIFPCCWGTSESQVFGDLINESFESIWTNKKYTYSRSLFAGWKTPAPTIKTICDCCGIYRKR